MTIDNILSTTGTGRLSDNDRLQLCQWNQFVPPAVHRCVHQMIHERSLLQADAIAVWAWDGIWSYRQLDEISTKFAHLLVNKHNVQPETFILICAEKSRWTPVAMLAVIKAGGAFVLVDPIHPPQRLKQMSDQVAAPLALESASCVSLAPNIVPKWLVIEEAYSRLKEKDHSLPMVPVSPFHALYVVFTSGSTGKPKGAVMTHSGYASSACHISAPIQLSPESRVLQFASYAFDVSVSDHLLTLLAGGCICIPSPTERDLATAINKMQVNWACLTPSVARTIRPARVPGLQHLVLAGEAVTQIDLGLWAPTSADLINMYGPAEHAIGVTVQGAMGATATPGCIGKAHAAVCWIVDPEDHDQLVPVGEVGELLVQGPALSRGYINDPVHTTAAFIEAPKWLSRGNKTASMYKTGDLDMMAKVRGQRVELGEVEHHLLKCCPEADEVIAEVVSTNSSTQLVVFLYAPKMNENTSKASSDQHLFHPPSAKFQEQSHSILSALEQLVPCYMVPSAIFRITHIPLTKTGKTDHRLLKEQYHQLLQQQCKIDKPALNKAVITPREEKLQCLWAEVLNIPPESIGRDDDWLALGGDSLMAMMLVSRARDTGLIMTMHDVFRHLRLSDLAASVGKVPCSLEEVQAPFSLLPDAPDVRQAILQTASKRGGSEVEDIYPCLEFQSWFCRLSMTMENNWTAEVEVILSPELSEERLAHAWMTVVQAHPMLRTHIVWLKESGPFWQVVRKEGLPMEIVTADQGPPRRKNIWGFNQPLARLYKQQNTLRLLFHHTGWDLQAISVVFQQLGRAYDGQTLPFRLVSPLVQWALRPSDAGKGFWRRRLAGLQAPEFPSLPAKDYVPRATAVSQNYPVRLSKRSERFTVDSRLRLALAIVISKATNAPHVLFGAAVARRGAPVPCPLEIVAPFTIMQPVPVRLDMRHTLREALQAVQDHSLEAMNYPKADRTFFRGLGPEIATTACDYHTLIELQPSTSTSVPHMFAEHTLHDHGVCNFALLLECEYLNDYTNVVAKYDEQVMSASQVNRLLEQLVYVAELTESAVDTSIGSIVLP
ncbi:nonribosomal peptide synthase [Aspergillus affinis]|uniref:nonribosomal peptide synthase n=1 Tax=Aspergillus affinis TaxID=1070780 RepID=UPI0022FE77A7|nr:nonribosomal peptide synthase [Aspergillus affinis]KAI9044894.1 nonribosomal peptide synthase [Aspergillus affinis]